MKTAKNRRSIDERWSRNGSTLALSLLAVTQWMGEAPVSAEWLLVDGNGKANVYVETETINRHGEWVRVWVMDDLKIPQARGLRKYLSSRAEEEHDCIKERFRLLALEYFSGNMGSGDVLYRTSGESNWTAVPRGTLAQSVWRFVCGKK